MIPLIILIISFIFDGLLTNYLPYLENHLSIFTPLLTIVSFIIIYPFYRKKEYIYFITLFITGIMYDLFYTNLLFFNGVLFVIIGFIISRIQKTISNSIINCIWESLLIIVLYESITAICLLLYSVVPITISEVIYKITHSLLLNVIYIVILNIIIKLIPKKYKDISIN